MEINKEIAERDAKLINLILDFAIENSMSMKEIDNCMIQVERVYYSDGLIKRG